MGITPRQGMSALLTTLALAESWERWDLYRETLRYIEEAGGRIQRIDTGLYLLQTEKD